MIRSVFFDGNGQAWEIDGDKGKHRYPADMDVFAAMTYYDSGFTYEKMDTLTRSECEIEVLDLLKKIRSVCNRYKRDMRVSMNIGDNGYLSAFALDDGDSEKLLLDAVEFADGTRKINGKFEWNDV